MTIHASKIWWPKIVARLKEMAHGGCSIVDIREAISKEVGRELSRNMIIGKLNRLGLSKPKKEWDPERILILKERYAEGRTYPQIGAELGVSRKVIAAAVLRFKLPPRKAPKRTITKPRGVRKLRLQPRVPKPLSEPVREFILGAGVKLLDLERQHCRWPLEDSADQVFFCGQQKEEGSSYCEHHTKLAWARTASEAREYKQEPGKTAWS